MNQTNEHGLPLHACNGFRHDEHYWAWIKEEMPEDRGIDVIIETNNLRIEAGDVDAMPAAIAAVIATNTDIVAQIKSGKDKAINQLIGKVMKALGGKADPAKVAKELQLRIKEL